MKSSKNNNKGFSLVEVLIAVSILTVVVAPIISTFISSSKLNWKARKELAATEIAQNMFEAITSMNDPEDAIIELSALTMDDPTDPTKYVGFSQLDLTTNTLIIPALDTDPATGVPAARYVAIHEAYLDTSTTPASYSTDPSAAMTHPFFIQSVQGEADASGNVTKYRCRGLKEKDNNGADIDSAQFYIQGLKQNQTYYDVKVCFDGSTYSDYYNSSSPTVTEPMKKAYKALPVIPSVEAYDCAYKEEANALSENISLEYKSKRLSVAREDYQILDNLERQYTVDVRKVSDTPARYTVELSVTYDYLDNSHLASVYAPPHGDAKLTVLDKSPIYDSDIAPRNIFLYYVPNYCSGASKQLDRFQINNEDDLDVNVYIIRTNQGTTYFSGNNATSVLKEKNYASYLMIKETSDDAINTHIRSNLTENIALDYDVRSTTDLPKLFPEGEGAHNEYTVSTGIAPADLHARDDKEIKNLEAVDDDNIRKRKYDVTIEVYVGQSGTEKGDNNHYIGYEGAYDNNKCTLDTDLLATFSGSIVK